MQANAPPTTPPKPRKRGLPILVRHAISLGVVFVLALPLSLYIGQAFYRNAQLNKLQATDASVFDQGLTYVYNHAGEDERVRDQALADCLTLPTDRAARLLLAVANAKPDNQPVDDEVYQTMGPMVQAMDVKQSLDLYDSLQQVPGVDRAKSANVLLNHLRPETDTDLLYAVDLLDQQYLWSKDDVPRELWVRWLVVLSQSSAKLTQLQAARLLSELPDDLEDGRIAEALDRLSASAHPEVRAQVLNAAAGYARIAKDPTDYEQIIFKLGSDENKIIARRAWLIVGHLNPLSGYAVNWKEADPFVAEAMLWASVKTNPENPKAALDAWTSGNEATAAFALHEVTPKHLAWRSPSGKLLLASLTQPPISDSELLRLWRSVPVLHDDWDEIILGDTRLKLWPTLFKHLKPDEVRSGKFAQLVSAYVYYGRVGFEPATWSEQDDALRYAWVEGLHRGPLETREMDIPTYYQVLGEQMDPIEAELHSKGGVLAENGDAFNPDVIPRYSYGRNVEEWFSILAAAGSDDPRPQFLETKSLDQYSNDPVTSGLWIAIHAEGARHLKPPFSDLLHTDSIARTLGGHDTARRNAAALYSGMIKYRPTLVVINEAFLSKHPDLTNDQLYAMSDDELTELGLQRVDALEALLDAAQAAPASAGRQPEVKLLKLALWMRGDLGDDFTPMAEAMLFDNDLPTSTVLMCLLHMQRPVALDYLFGDLVTPRPDLHELFISERWWHVFRRFVDTSDLTLWLWGDPAAQAFQIEAMRQWYAVNRWRIERGWWPELIDD